MIIKKRVRTKPWHRWYAWRPVKLLCGRGVAWLTYVERRKVYEQMWIFGDLRKPLITEYQPLNGEMR